MTQQTDPFGLCPSCGEDTGWLNFDGDLYDVVCLDAHCGYRTKEHRTKEAARKEWDSAS